MRKIYDFRESPMRVFGIPFFDEKKTVERIPPELREKLPKLSFLGRRTPGARLCFRTDSPRFTVKMTLEGLGYDIGMSIFSGKSANVLLGDRKNYRFLGLVNPPDYNTKSFSKTFTKSDGFEDVTVFFPRCEVVKELEIEIEADSTVEAPTPYKYEKPVVFYGSSITEGGCAMRVTNVYSALLSNRLDTDYINFGFSGSALGETEMADYINTLPMGAFVLDYDHNAPNAEHLKATHEPFFERIRKAHPDLPVIMLTKPDFYPYREDCKLRRAVVKQTYDNAVARGDKNVYFIGGDSYFGDERELCTCDTCHPNDYGFMKMANAIEPVLAKILKETETENL